MKRAVKGGVKPAAIEPTPLAWSRLAWVLTGVSGLCPACSRRAAEAWLKACSHAGKRK